MLTSAELGWKENGGEDTQGTSDALMSLAGFLRTLLKLWWAVALVAVLGFALSVFFLRSIPPRYSSEVQIALDMSRMLTMNDRLDPTIGIPKISLVMTQVALVQSDANLLSVVERLGLDHEEAFAGVVAEPDRGSFRRRLAVLFGLAAPAPSGVASTPEAERRLAIVAAIRRYLLVERVDQTYVVRIMYMATDPILGAKITNAIAGQYLDDQLLARFDATLRAGDWIERRLADLRKASTSAALAVENYRQSSSIVTAGGRTLTEAEVNALARAVAEAERNAAAAVSRRDEIDKLKASGEPRTVLDSINDTNLIGLRKQYTQASAVLSRIRSGSGRVPRFALAEQQRKIDALETQIASELDRIAARARQTADVALFKLDEIKQDATDARIAYIGQQERSVRLRELERSAQVMNQAYGTFFGGYLQLNQKNAYPTSEARTLSSAVRASAASYPSKPMVLVNCMIASLVVGAAAAIAFSRSANGLKSADDVASIVGRRCLAVLSRPPRRRNPDLADHIASDPAFFRLCVIISLRPSPGGRGTVIAVAEGFPLAGATAVAEALATILSQRGQPVALLRTLGTGSSRALAKEENRDAHGPVEILLPSDRDIQGGSRIKRLGEIITEARDTYRFIVVDAPPLSRTVDAGHVAELSDLSLLAVRWGAPYGAVLRREISQTGPLSERLLGVILYDAPPRLAALRRLFARRGMRAAYPAVSAKGRA